MSRTAKKVILYTAVMALALGSGYAFGKPPEGKGKSAEKPHQTGQSPEVIAKDKDHEESLLKFLFSDDDRHFIRDYYVAHPDERNPKSLPPGLKKNLARGKSLPPGWQKKVARGEVLDEGAYLHGYPLPGGILSRWPNRPSGIVDIRVEGKVVRLIEATRTIIDVLNL